MKTKFEIYSHVILRLREIEHFIYNVMRENGYWTVNRKFIKFYWYFWKNVLFIYRKQKSDVVFEILGNLGCSISTASSDFSAK